MNGENATGGMADTLKMLEQLRLSFVNELPERCNSLETLALALAQPGGLDDNYQEFYRAVHSLKGSGGTYGLPVVTQICHQFEEHLSSLAEQGGDVGQDGVNLCLKYIDLIKRAAYRAARQDTDFSAIEQELQRCKQEPKRQTYSGLVVDSSSAIAMMCQDALSGLPLELAVEENGRSALEVLQNTHFDFLVTSRELDELNGVDLICALRKSKSKNKDIKTIMLSSALGAKVPHGGRPDYLIIKDSSFPRELKTIVGQLIQQFDKSASG